VENTTTRGCNAKKTTTKKKVVAVALIVDWDGLPVRCDVY
jgi:hypothetical protein